MKKQQGGTYAREKEGEANSEEKLRENDVGKKKSGNVLLLQALGFHCISFDLERSCFYTKNSGEGGEHA